MEKSVSLFVMSKKGYETLDAICKSDSSIVSCVISSRDKNVLNDYYEEIKALCNLYKLPFYDRNEDYAITTAYAIAISWRWIINIKPSVLIVFHDSLLPRYRGFNPLVTALINGDEKIGVSAILATKEFDRGNILAQSCIDIEYPMKIESAIDLICSNYRALANKIIDIIKDGTELAGCPQNDEDASYSLWRDDDDYNINWSLHSAEIKRFIDAVGFPYKGAMTIVNGRKVRVLDSDLIADVNIEQRCPGKVIFIADSKPVVVCGEGLLKINELIDEQTKESVLPLSNFRVRFGKTRNLMHSIVSNPVTCDIEWYI